MGAANNFTWGYLIFGGCASAMVASGAYKLKIITKDSEFLYFNFGFYRHFLVIYIKNFFVFPRFLINLAFGPEPRPLIFQWEIGEMSKSDFALLVASFNMACGLLFVDLNGKKLFVHTTDKRFFEKIDLEKIREDISKISDISLI